MKASRVLHRPTGAVSVAIYAETRRHSLRYHIDGKPIDDRTFDRSYLVMRTEDPAKDRFLELVSGKKVLFLEGSDDLPQYQAAAADLLDQFNIGYTAFTGAYDSPLDQVFNAIKEAEIILFQSTWTTEKSREIKRKAFAMADKKIFVENFIQEPSWYYKPRAAHDIFILSCTSPNHWKFYKLSDKPYWSYHNKFDK